MEDTAYQHMLRLEDADGLFCNREGKQASFTAATRILLSEENQIVKL